MPLTSSISTSGNTLLIGHSPIPLWSYEDFTQYPKVGYGGLDQDQADLREQVLKVSGE